MSHAERESERTDASRSDPDALKLNEGLDALMRRDPEGAARLAEEAPLQLVAAAIVDIAGKTRGATAKTSEIRDGLSSRIITHDALDRWWDPVRNGIRSSHQFSGGHPKPIRLLAKPAEIASGNLDELREAARKARSGAGKSRSNARNGAGKSSASEAPSLSGLGGWILWVQSDDEEPMPRSVPSDEFTEFLRKLPAGVTPTAIERLSKGVRQRLLDAKQRPADQSIKQWQEVLVTALDRWMALEDASSVSIADTATLAAHVLDTLGQGEFENLVAWLARYASKDGMNTVAMGDALLSASRVATDGTERLLVRMRDLLDAPVRMALWRHLLGSALIQRPKPPVERWLRLLAPTERSEVIMRLLMTVSDDDAITEIGFVVQSEWRRADAGERSRLFDTVALGWLLHDRLRTDAGAMMQKLAESGNKDGLALGDCRMTEWQVMIQSAAKNEVERVRGAKDRRISELERRLEETESELKQTEKYAKFLRGENRKASRTAALEITGDAITVLGITLQDLATSTVPKSLETVDVESRIKLALSALGAKPFGEVGKSVPFDPSIHEAKPPPAIGTPVRITAPGQQYFWRKEAPANIVKVQVQVQEQL